MAPISYTYYSKPSLIRSRRALVHCIYPENRFPDRDGFIINSTALGNGFLWAVFLTQLSMEMDCYMRGFLDSTVLEMKFDLGLVLLTQPLGNEICRDNF